MSNSAEVCKDANRVDGHWCSKMACAFFSEKSGCSALITTSPRLARKLDPGLTRKFANADTCEEEAAKEQSSRSIHYKLIEFAQNARFMEMNSGPTPRVAQVATCARKRSAAKAVP